MVAMIWRRTANVRVHFRAVSGHDNRHDGYADSDSRRTRQMTHTAAHDVNKKGSNPNLLVIDASPGAAGHEKG